MTDYNPISARLLRTPIAVFNSKRQSPPPVKPTSPAIPVMTDLRDEGVNHLSNLLYRCYRPAIFRA